MEKLQERREVAGKICLEQDRPDDVCRQEQGQVEDPPDPGER